jgi:drug/metabolite transporter (DMT)-like permease
MPPSTGAPPARGFALLAAVTLFWGVNWPAMKLGLEVLGPWSFAALRLVIGAAGLFACALAFRQRLALPPADRRPLLLASVLSTTCWQLFAGYGLSLLPAGRSAIIAFTMPLWATLLSAMLLGERLDRAKVAALALGLAGLSLLIVGEWRAIGAAPAGAFFMLAAALSWGASAIVVKRHRWTLPSWPLTGWQVLIGGLPIMLLAPFIEPDFTRPGVSLAAIPPLTWASLLYCATVPVVFCQWGWVRLLQIFPASLAAIGTLMIPVVGVWSSALLLGERLGPAELGALACVVASLALVLRPRARAA